ncbi:MAG: GNAT family N-acetyltransferase [Dehalococcoidales bacterium]|nr:GNAT family N-acetyltransferase [Dehalococcoidales bacterium]
MERKWIARQYKDGDEDAIFGLTKAVYGEQDKDVWMRRWQWIYKDNPGGVGRIWLADDNGLLAGHYSLVYMWLKIGDKIVKASQNIDQMTHPDYRRQGIARTLATKALEEAGSEGIPVTTAFTNESSYVIDLKTGFVNIDLLKALVKPLELKKILGKYVSNKFLLKTGAGIMSMLIGIFRRTVKAPEVEGLKITRVTRFDERINDLWKEIADDYRVLVVRDREYLNWRYVDIPDIEYTIFTAELEGKILGYMVLRCESQPGLTFGRIYDLVVPAGQQAVAHTLILKAIEYFKERKADLVIYRVIAGKSLIKTLKKCGFFTVPFTHQKTDFLIRTNTADFSEELFITPGYWFVQTGDSDAL